MNQRDPACDRSDEIRTLAQNAKFHSTIADIARQTTWAGGPMDEEEWKRLFLAAAYGQRMVPNPFYPTKPFIVLNVRRSSGLVVPEMADLITEIQVFGDERGVKWAAE